MLAAAVALLGGCGPEPRAGPPDLWLVSVDTLRPDHLGAYGYERGTTPHIDALARESVVFETAIAHAPSTLPSHASILTSLVPSWHGAFLSLRQPLPEAVVTVAKALRDAGYRRVAFVEGGQLAPVFDVADLQHVKNAYDAEIVHMDLGVRGLVRRLRERDR